jgi:hypothetical protein
MDYNLSAQNPTGDPLDVSFDFAIPIVPFTAHSDLVFTSLMATISSDGGTAQGLALIGNTPIQTFSLHSGTPYEGAPPGPYETIAATIGDSEFVGVLNNSLGGGSSITILPADSGTVSGFFGPSPGPVPTGSGFTAIDINIQFTLGAHTDVTLSNIPGDHSASLVAVPEPGSLTVLGLGLASIAACGWLKKRTANVAAV